MSNQNDNENSNRPARRPRPEGTERPVRKPRPEGTDRPVRKPRPEGSDGPVRRPRPEGTDRPVRKPRPEGADRPVRKPRPEGTDRPVRKSRPEGTDRPVRKTSQEGVRRPSSGSRSTGANRPPRSGEERRSGSDRRTGTERRVNNSGRPVERRNGEERRRPIRPLDAEERRPSGKNTRGKNSRNNKQPQNVLETVFMRRAEIVDYWRIIYFVVAMIYLEFTFHKAVFETGHKYFAIPFFFAIFAGSFIALFSNLFNKYVNAILGYGMLLFSCIIYIAEMIYYQIFATFFSIKSTSGAGDAMDFKHTMFTAMRHRAGTIFLLLLPVIVLAFCHKVFFKFEKTSAKTKIANAITVVASLILAFIALSAYGKGKYTPYYYYKERFVINSTIEYSGVPATFMANLRSMSGKQESELIEFNTNDDDDDISPYKIDETSTDAVESPTDANPADNIDKTGPNIDESIDFETLYNGTDNTDLKNLCAYYNSKTPTNKNEYTGYFKGKNLIYITAESLWGPYLQEEYAPTLYKLMNNGFVFDNYYCPLWMHSTIDGEYANTLSQVPLDDDWAMIKSADNYEPYALGTMFRNEGYQTTAYHDYTAFYFTRDKSHANLGYDYKAVDLGLVLPSVGQGLYLDTEMMDVVVDEIKDQDQFSLYIMSYSGHLPYDQSNPIAAKWYERAKAVTEGKDLTNNDICYIACQMEFDNSLKTLLDGLERNGQLEDTVIVIAPDHYPYNLEEYQNDSLVKFAGERVTGTKAQNRMEKSYTCLSIYCADMEQPVHISKTVGSMDILPTLLNLFGFTYDSRLLTGRDALSDSEGLVIYGNGSFYSDEVKFDAKAGTTESRNGLDYDPDKINQLKDDVEMMITMSHTALFNDVYSYIYGKPVGDN